MSTLVTSASNAISFAPPSPAPENWLVAARIPPEYASNFSGKNSGGNGSFKRRNGQLSQLPELCLGPPDPWGFARLLGFPGFRSPPGIPREQPLPYGAYNRPVTALYSAITAIFGLISDCARDLFILTAAARPRRHRIKQASCNFLLWADARRQTLQRGFRWYNRPIWLHAVLRFRTKHTAPGC